MKTLTEKSYISRIYNQDNSFLVINSLNFGETVSRAFPSKTFKTEKGAEKYSKRFFNFCLS